MYDDAGRLMVLFQINRYIQQLRYSFFFQMGAVLGVVGVKFWGERELEHSYIT